MFDFLGNIFGAALSLYEGRRAKKAAEQQARIAEQRAQVEAAQIRRATEQAKARRIASFVARGVSLDGSAGAVIQDEEDFGLSQASDTLNLASASASLTRYGGKTLLNKGIIGSIGKVFSAGSS